MNLKKGLEYTIGACAVAGIYIIAWALIIAVFNPQPLEWSALKWITAVLGTVGGTAFYIRSCIAIMDLVRRYVKVEKIDKIP